MLEGQKPRGSGQGYQSGLKPSSVRHSPLIFLHSDKSELLVRKALRAVEGIPVCRPPEDFVSPPYRNPVDMRNRDKWGIFFDQ